MRGTQLEHLFEYRQQSFMIQIFLGNFFIVQKKNSEKNSKPPPCCDFYVPHCTSLSKSIITTAKSTKSTYKLNNFLHRKVGASPLLFLNIFFEKILFLKVLPPKLGKNTNFWLHLGMSSKWVFHFRYLWGFPMSYIIGEFLRNPS